ncbi:thioesterase II family protein [Spongiimicrobium salis]|uniref:thioesterase II family protein n=1 Tax=Spongiimicrobium salis TaxID=1667022 RepID=UPI00374CE908
MKKQIFLLHFAGGNRYSYNFLKKYLDEEFEFIPLELPGRGGRINEKCITNKNAAVDDYVHQIMSLRNSKPYLIYGHSMGAALGLLVTGKMEEVGDAPVNLLVSGNAGPIKEEKKKPKRYLLGEEEFKKMLLKFGGVSEEVLENKELYELFDPIIRSDFKLLEEDDYSEEGLLLKTSIHALMGDKEETVDKIDNWNKFSLQNCSYTVFPGGHFFIYDQSDTLSKIMKSTLLAPAHS